MKKRITEDKAGTYCPECVNGAMFEVEVSKLEAHFGHRVYECDKCHSRYKVLPTEDK